MTKYCGKIGFATTTETIPGNWEEQFTERIYYGDLIRNSRKLQSSGNQNDNITISNEISIVADPFAYENFHAIRYAEFMGSKWKVTSVDVQYPRLLLSLGEVYNA